MLLALYEGRSLDEVLEQITAPVRAPEPVDTEDYATALARPATPVTSDDTALQAVKLGVYLLDAIKREAPARFAWRTDAYEFVTDKPAIDLLWGSSELRECLDQSGDVDTLLEKAAAEVATWRPTW